MLSYSITSHSQITSWKPFIKLFRASANRPGANGAALYLKRLTESTTRFTRNEALFSSRVRLVSQTVTATMEYGLLYSTQLLPQLVHVYSSSVLS